MNYLQENDVFIGQINYSHYFFTDRIQNNRLICFDFEKGKTFIYYCITCCIASCFLEIETKKYEKVKSYIKIKKTSHLTNVIYKNSSKIYVKVAETVIDDIPNSIAYISNFIPKEEEDIDTYYKITFVDSKK